MNEVSARTRRFIGRHPGAAADDERLLELCNEIDRLQKELTAARKSISELMAFARGQ